MGTSARCAICGIRCESNTFSAATVGLDGFTVQRGEEILQDEAWRAATGIEWVPTLVARAAPDGPVSNEAYVTLRDESLTRLQAALALDGVHASLHGAMEVEGIGDGETDLVRAIRAVVGQDLPTVASLDLHANIPPDVAASTSVLTTLQTAPHVDGAATRGEPSSTWSVACGRACARPLRW